MMCHHLWNIAGNPQTISQNCLHGSASKRTRPQCRRHERQRLDPWVGKIPWRRKGQPTPVFLPEKSHGQRNLAGYSPKGCIVRHGWGIQQQQLIWRNWLTKTQSACVAPVHCQEVQCKIKEEMVGSRITQETKNSWVKSVLKDDWL